MKAQLDKGALLVAKAAAKDGVRQMLKVAKLGEGEIVATDGAILVRYPVETEGNTILIPAADLKRVKPMRHVGKVMVSAEDTLGNGATCTLMGDATVISALETGQFPNYTQVYPKEDKDVVFKVAFMRDTLKKLLDCLEDGPIRMEFTGETGAIKFTSGEHHGLIMPAQVNWDK